MKKTLISIVLILLLLNACTNNFYDDENTVPSIPNNTEDNSTTKNTTEVTKQTSSKEATTAIIEHGDALSSYWQGLLDAEVTRENFLSKYFSNLLDESLLGIWTQQDITYFLTKCVQEDIKKNGEKSKFSFAKNEKVQFLYRVNTSSGAGHVTYLVDKRNKNDDFPDFKFVELTVYIRWRHESFDYDDIKTYQFETYGPKDISFSDTEGFIKYLNKQPHKYHVFFERGWLEIKD